MTEVPTENKIEQDPAITYGIEVIRDGENYIRTTLGETKYRGLHHSLQTKESIDSSLARTEGNEFGLFIKGRWALDTVGYVNLRTNFREGTSEEDIEKAAGFVDEDSFAFVWQVMDRFAELDEAATAIETRAEAMLTHLRYFIGTQENFEKVAKDPRLSGLIGLNAAVELAQIRDFEGALSELERIPEERLRKRLMRSLADVVELESTLITPEDSHHNLETYVRRIHAPNVPPVGEHIDTRIVSNRSIRTFKNMFDPFSNGRVYASVYGIQQRLDDDISWRPSSGDNSSRMQNERMLGHERRLFAPRIAYGAVVEADHVEDGSENAWSFGGTRFVLRNSSYSAEQATYTFGDSLNGTPLNAGRVLLRDDANRGSRILREINEGNTSETSRGSVSHYIEAQFAGLHIADIQSIVLRPGLAQHKENEELIEVAETAALHGIEVTYIFDWDLTREHRQWSGGSTQEIADQFKEELVELKSRSPHVHIKLETKEETDSKEFDSLDPNIATVRK